jgi:hypothetical protein
MRLLGLLSILVLTACPSKTSEVEKCTKFGQACQFGPGKLGSCVYTTGCDRAECLVCQSQH